MRVKKKIITATVSYPNSSPEKYILEKEEYQKILTALRDTDGIKFIKGQNIHGIMKRGNE